VELGGDLPWVCSAFRAVRPAQRWKDGGDAPSGVQCSLLVFKNRADVALGDMV